MGPGEEVGYPSQHEKDAVGVDTFLTIKFGDFLGYSAEKLWGLQSVLVTRVNCLISNEFCPCKLFVCLESVRGERNFSHALTAGLW